MGRIRGFLLCMQQPRHGQDIATIIIQENATRLSDPRICSDVQRERMFRAAGSAVPAEPVEKDNRGDVTSHSRCQLDPTRAKLVAFDRWRFPSDSLRAPRRGTVHRSSAAPNLRIAASMHEQKRCAGRLNSRLTAVGLHRGFMLFLIQWLLLLWRLGPCSRAPWRRFADASCPRLTFVGGDRRPRMS